MKCIPSNEAHSFSMPVFFSQFFTKLRPFSSKSEKTVFAANAKSFLCMQEARENGQNFKTSFSNSPPHGRLRTSNSGEHLKSNSRDMPGGGGGGVLKFRIDRYITLTTYSEKCESSPVGS